MSRWDGNGNVLVTRSKKVGGPPSILMMLFRAKVLLVGCIVAEMFAKLVGIQPYLASACLIVSYCQTVALAAFVKND